MQKRTRAKKEIHPRARAASAKGKRQRSNPNKQKTVLSRLKKALDDTAAQIRALLPAEAKGRPRDDANEMS